MQINRKLIALGVVGLLGLAAVPAQADSVIRFGDKNAGITLRISDGRHDGRKSAHVVNHRQERARLAPRQIRRILRRSGFHDISRPEYRPRGDVYVVNAENRRNRDVRVRVDADTGRILNVARLAPPRRTNHGANHGANNGQRHGGGRGNNRSPNWGR